MVIIMGLGKVIKTAKMDIVIKVVGVMKRQRNEKVHTIDMYLDLPYQDIDLKTYEQDAIALIKEKMKSWSRVELYLSPWTQVDEEGYPYSMREVTFGDKRYRKISLEVGA